MKILYVVPHSPWPPDLGARMRDYGVLRLLAQRHDVVVALASNSPRELSLFENGSGRIENRVVLQRNPALLHRRLVSHTWERCRPIRIFNACTYGRFEESLHQLAERTNPDLIWFFRLDTIWQTGCGRFSMPVTVDMDDLESKALLRSIRALTGFPRLLASVDSFQFMRAQRATTQNCNLILIANPLDVAEAAAITGKPVMALPNAFDYSAAPSTDQPRDRRAIFIGHLPYKPNSEGVRWFLDEVWPRIRAEVPDARFDIGGHPSPAVAGWDRESGVQVCGFVEDVGVFSRNAAVAVVPILRGGGTRIKILEAWALGLPVISTSVGCEGLGAVDGQTLWIADTPELFTRRCVELILHPEKGKAIVERAYAYAKLHFDWSTLEPTLEEVIAMAMTGCRTKGGK